MIFLKVIYDKQESGINAELDNAIEEAFKAIGFTRWASGYDLTTGKRDLAFDGELKCSKTKQTL